MSVRTLGLLLLILLSSVGAAQDTRSQSRPASRSSAQVTAEEWKEWVDGLSQKAAPDPYRAAENAVSVAWFGAQRMKDCGALPAFDKKGEKPTMLQPVSFVVAGFDPKQTFLESVGRSPAVHVEYGAGFGVRGVETLSVSGPVQYYQGDATSEHLEIPKPLGLDDMGVIGKIIKDAGLRLEHPITFDVKDCIVFAVPLKNEKNPAAVPKFARGLRSRGARAVLAIDDKGTAETSSPTTVARRDHFRRPASEDPPALFLTSASSREIEKANRVSLSVRFRTKDLDIPNIVARIEGKDPSFAVVVSASLGRRGQTCAALLAATRVLAHLAEPPQRTIILAMYSRPDLDFGGQDWFLGHPAVPAGKIVAAIHLDDGDGDESGSAETSIVSLASATRSCRDLEDAAREALHRSSIPPGSEGSLKGLRCVEAYAKRGIPAIGIVPGVECLESTVIAAQVAADLAVSMANRPERPAFTAH